jgi:hypothetical protein
MAAASAEEASAAAGLAVFAAVDLEVFAAVDLVVSAAGSVGDSGASAAEDSDVAMDSMAGMDVITPTRTDAIISIASRPDGGVEECATPHHLKGQTAI